MGNYRTFGTALDRVFRNDLNNNFTDIATDIEAQKIRVNSLITGTPQPSEVVDARGGKAVLKDRLDAVDTSLAEMASISNLTGMTFADKLNTATSLGLKRVVLKQGETYILSTSITLTNLIIDGKGATISVGDTGKILLGDRSGIVDAKLSSATSNYNSSSLLSMIQVVGSNVKISGIIFDNRFFHYTIKLLSLTSTPVSKAIVNNCEFVGIVQHGVQAYGDIDGLKVENCLFKNTGGNATGGIQSTLVTNIEICNNIFDANLRFGVEFYGATQVKIHDNQFINNSAFHSISMPACINVDIYQNVFKNNSLVTMIEITGVTDYINIFGNLFIDNTFSPVIVNVTQSFNAIKFNNNKVIRCTSTVSLLQLLNVNVDSTAPYFYHFECANNQFVQTSYLMLTGNIHDNYFSTDDNYLTNGNLTQVLLYLNVLFKDNIMEYIGDVAESAFIGLNRNNIKVIGNVFKCNSLVTNANSFVAGITGVTCINNFVYGATGTGITVTSTQGTVANNYSLTA
jgi:hypothetical protein